MARKRGGGKRKYTVLKGSNKGGKPRIRKIHYKKGSPIITTSKTKRKKR